MIEYKELTVAVRDLRTAIKGSGMTTTRQLAQHFEQIGFKRRLAVHKTKVRAALKGLSPGEQITLRLPRDPNPTEPDRAPYQNDRAFAAKIQQHREMNCGEYVVLHVQASDREFIFFGKPIA